MPLGTKDKYIGLDTEALKFFHRMLGGLGLHLSGSFKVCEAAKADVFRNLFDKRTLSVTKIMAIRSALGNEMWIEKWEGDRITVRGWSDDLKTLVSRTKTGGSTAAQIIEARLKGSPVVDPESVKIESMTDVGKDAALKQIVVVVKFKFGKGGER